MANIPIECKRELSRLLGEGHLRFGQVAPRRAYRDEDDQAGGAGAAGLVFPEHPLLAETPLGAASDLTYIVTDNNQAFDEARARYNEAVPELQKQIDKALEKGYGHKQSPHLTRY